MSDPHRPTIVIGPDDLTLDDIRRTLAGPVTIAIAPSAAAAIAASHALVDALLATGEPIYGVNTGFGKLAKARIADADLKRLQINLVRSHAAGTGQPLAPEIVRLILLLKIKSLSRGTFRHRAGDPSAAGGDDRPRRPAGHPVAGLGWCLRRPRAARPSVAGGDRRGRGAGRRHAHERRRGAGAGRHRAGGAWAERGVGAPERHPGLDRHRACRTDRRRAGDACGGGRRSAVDRRHQGLRHTVRPSHPRAAAASRPGAPRCRLPPAPRRERDPRLASRRRRQGAGSLFLPLPAPGHGCRPRPSRHRRARP